MRLRLWDGGDGKGKGKDTLRARKELRKFGVGSHVGCWDVVL
jgi:hypothetical protein